MRRRHFITTLGGAAATLAFNDVQAQQADLPIVGCLAAPAEATYAHQVAAVRQGLKDSGLVEGQSFRLEFRWADGQYDRLPTLAADLIRRRVSVIITMGGSPPIQAAKMATTTVPIVFHLGADPVRLGLVASLNRPGGNITGVTLMTNSLEPKRLELLQKMVPNARSFGVLVNPTNQQNGIQLRQLEQVTASNGLKLVSFEASTVQRLEALFANMVEKEIEALTVLSDAFFTSNSLHIASLSERYRIPTIAHSREFVLAGGLISYGADLTDAYRLVGAYAGRILKGDSPAELPIIEPTRFDFLINLRTAKKLSVAVPAVLLAIADEVIE